MRILKARGFAAALVACAAFLSLPAMTLMSVQTASAASSTVRASTLTPRGTWSASINYVLNDLVASRGSSWRAKRASLGKLPGSTSPSTADDWELLAGGLNPLGTWSSTTTFQRRDLVTHQGSTWRALRTNLNKIPLASPNDWQLFASKGARGATGPQGPQG